VIELGCPACRSSLAPAGADAQRCSQCGVAYRRTGGIWRMLVPGREEVIAPFLRRYEAVRAAEGRVVPDLDALDRLPFEDASGKRRGEWAVRAKSYEAFLRWVVVPLERRLARPLVVCDLGSGVGWLAHRLARLGHSVLAVDIVTSDTDGLGVHRCCTSSVALVQAEFDRLPLFAAAADLVVYNASLHYSADLDVTLGEGLRVLRPDGRLVILDSPIYEDAESGRAMRRERGHDTTPQEGFLTYDRLRSLEPAQGLSLHLVSPWYGVRWWLRPLVARVRGTREPAQFRLIVAQRV
jgi:SAM-dependent methyltransferase